MAYAQQDGRNYPLDRTDVFVILRRLNELSQASKRLNQTEYGFFLKEVDQELEKTAMKREQSVMEMSLLQQQAIRSQQRSNNGSTILESEATIGRPTSSTLERSTLLLEISYGRPAPRRIRHSRHYVVFQSTFNG